MWEFEAALKFLSIQEAEWLQLHKSGSEGFEVGFEEKENDEEA